MERASRSASNTAPWAVVNSASGHDPDGFRPVIVTPEGEVVLGQTQLTAQNEHLVQLAVAFCGACLPLDAASAPRVEVRAAGLRVRAVQIGTDRAVVDVHGRHASLREFASIARVQR